MKVEIVIASGKGTCRSESCKKLPEYIENGFIKAGNQSAKFSVKLNGKIQNFFICRDCIDLVFNEIKLKLNTRLWVID